MMLLLTTNIYSVVLFPALPLGVLLVLFLILFLSVRKARNLSLLALPSELPPEQEPNDLRFGRTSGYYAGSFLKGQRYLLLPLQVWGKGFGGTGNGKVWLSRQAIILRRYLIRTPVIVPYALIHRIEVRKGAMAGGKYYPGAIIIVTWGREELPIVSYFGIAGGLELAAAWAKEIARRGDALKWQQTDTAS